MDTVVGRIEKLERQNRVLKLAALFLFIMVAGVGAMQKRDQSVTAQKFTLVDASGNVRAVLTVDELGTGTMLTFRTATGATRLQVGLSNAEPHVDVWDNAARQWRNKVGGATVWPAR